MKNDFKNASTRRPHRDVPVTIYHFPGTGSMQWDSLGHGFLVHPLALNPQIGHPPATDADWSPMTAAKHPVQLKTKGTPVATNRATATESSTKERLARAAKQLHVQAEESRVVFKSFYDKYTMEIKGVRQYVNGDVRQRIWEGRIERNAKHGGGAGEVDERLAYQNERLRSCLARFLESAVDAVSEDYITDESLHDSLALQIEKIQAAGERVERLSRKALLNEAACRDVVNELGELRYLTDPQRPSGAQVYQLDRRGRQKDQCEQEYEDERVDELYDGGYGDAGHGEVGETVHYGIGENGEEAGHVA